MNKSKNNWLIVFLKYNVLYKSKKYYMIWNEDFLSLEMNGINFLDKRTLNALNYNANIYTINDLLNFYDDIGGIWIKTIPWIWVNWIERIEKLIKYLQSLNIGSSKAINKKTEEDVLMNIDKGIYNSDIVLYSSFLSLRTINALKRKWIITVWDLLEKRNMNFLLVRWLWEDGVWDIQDFIKYILKNYSINNARPSTDETLANLLDDKRLVQLLEFNGIQKISDLEPLINKQEKFLQLRYVKIDDYQKLKEIYDNINKKDLGNNLFADVFMRILKNLSNEDAFILNQRILWNLTLEEVGNKLWITRERARQKQKQVERIIQEGADIFLQKNPEISLKIDEIINTHWFILLPQMVNFFDFLWFTDDSSKILYLFLKWLDWIKGEIINNDFFCIFSDTINLNANELTNIYKYVEDRLDKNNDDIVLDDLFYELILDDVINKNTIQVTKKINQKKRKTKKNIDFKNVDFKNIDNIESSGTIQHNNNIYEVIL